MSKLFTAALFVGLCAVPAVAAAKGPAPEDLLKGRIIVSDHKLPMHWSSVSSYVAQLKKDNKETLWYDKKTGKLTIEYAAFFAKPLNDVQVDLVIYDITGGKKDRRASSEQFMNRGERVLFNSVTFDKEDFEMNKKYRLVVESRHQVLAAGEFTLRGEGPHYSGTVNFTDEETRQKD
jgi:hypothetical protein